LAAQRYGIFGKRTKIFFNNNAHFVEKTLYLCSLFMGESIFARTLFINTCSRMKKWIFAYLILCVTFTTHAQLTFGARAGVTYTSLTQEIDGVVTYGGRIGYSVAGLLDIPLNRNFSLRPEIALISQGGAYSLEFMEEPFWKRYKRNYFTVQIPANFSYLVYRNNEWQIGVYAGPTISLSTKITEREGLEERRFRTFDVGIGEGFYVQYYNLFFTIYSHSGLLDRLEDKFPNESRLFQNNVMFAFGYWFRR